ncbi:hypothetical protein LTR85_011103 [Meristemomyces frigidus]|nr:hypothetical protein LTR85_011103 [Meristemomyces frigidus]
MGWIEALDCAEERAWWDRLSSLRKDIVSRVMKIEWLAQDSTEFERRKGDESSLEFRKQVFDAYYQMDDELFEYLRPLIEDDQEIALTPYGTLRGPYNYWWSAIAQIDRNGFEEGSTLHKARGCAVLKIINRRRVRKAGELYQKAYRWIDSVGDPEIEIEGFEVQGDFWHIHILFWQSLEEVLYEYWAELGVEEAGLMEVELLQSIILNGRTVEEIQAEQRVLVEARETAESWAAEEPDFAQPLDNRSV